VSLEIIATDLREELIFANPDFGKIEAGILPYEVGFEFVTSTTPWATIGGIAAEIKIDGFTSYLELTQTTVSGGQLVLEPHALNDVEIRFFIPAHESDNVGIRIILENGVTELRIRRSLLSIYQDGLLVWSEDWSWSSIGNQFTALFSGTLWDLPAPYSFNIDSLGAIQQIMLFSEDNTLLPVTKFAYIKPRESEQRNMEIRIEGDHPNELVNYSVGDLLIVIMHSDCPPRNPLEFLEVSNIYFPTFYVRTLTTNEPTYGSLNPPYKFSRGDAESYYGVEAEALIIRGVTEEQLQVTWSEIIFSLPPALSVGEIVESSSTNAVIGEIIYGAIEGAGAQFEPAFGVSELSQNLTAYDSTLVREIEQIDDGKAKFATLTNFFQPFERKIITARISSSTPTPPIIILGDTHYQPWSDFADSPEVQPINTAPRVQTSDNPYAPWSLLEEAPEPTEPISGTRVQTSDNPYAPWSLLEDAPEPTEPISGTRAQSKNSSYAPWSYLEDVPTEPELPMVMLTNAVSAQLFEATDLLEADGLYERAQMNVAPDWMLNGYARAFIRASGALKDDLAELLLGAAFISMTVGADRDTLERKARDRALFVIPLEPLEVLRERVSNAFDVLDMAGTIPGLEKALFDAGWNTRVIELYTQMPTDDWDETDVDVWDETTLEVWDGGEAQMFIVFVWQRIPVPLVVQQLPILIQQFKSAESLLKALYQLPANWDDTTPLPWESAGTLIYGV
jgi:hypothetical protein